MFLNSLKISNFTTDSNNFTWLAESHWESSDLFYFVKNINTFPSYAICSPFIRTYKHHPKRKVKDLTRTNLFGCWILKQKPDYNNLGIALVEGSSKIYKTVNLHYIISPDTTSNVEPNLNLDDSLDSSSFIIEALPLMISSLFISGSFDAVNLIDHNDCLNTLSCFSSYKLDILYSLDLKPTKKIVISPSLWKQDHDSIYEKLDYLNARKLKL